MRDRMGKPLNPADRAEIERMNRENAEAAKNSKRGVGRLRNWEWD